MQVSHSLRQKEFIHFLSEKVYLGARERSVLFFVSFGHFVEKNACPPLMSHSSRQERITQFLFLQNVHFEGNSTRNSHLFWSFLWKKCLSAYLKIPNYVN